MFYLKSCWQINNFKKRIDLKELLKKISANLQIKKMLFRFDEQLLPKNVYLNLFSLLTKDNFFYDIQFTLIILSATLNPTWKLNWPVFTVQKNKIRESFSSIFIVSWKPFIIQGERFGVFEKWLRQPNSKFDQHMSWLEDNRRLPNDLDPWYELNQRSDSNLNLYPFQTEEGLFSERISCPLLYIFSFKTKDINWFLIAFF